MDAWLQFAESVVGAVLSIVFLITGAVLTILGHAVAPEIWGAAVTFGGYAAGAATVSMRTKQ